MFKKHIQIPPTLDLLVAKMLKLSIGSGIAEKIAYQPQRLISLHWTHKISLKLERGRFPFKMKMKNWKRQTFEQKMQKLSKKVQKKHKTWERKGMQY